MNVSKPVHAAATIPGLILAFATLACPPTASVVEAPSSNEDACLEKGPTVYGSGHGDVFTNCGPLLANPALNTTLSVSSSRSLSAATRDWFCDIASDQKAFSFASAVSVVVPDAIPIPADIKASGAYSREKRQTVCAENTWKLDDFSTLNVLQTMTSHEDNLKAYVECSKTVSDKGGMRIQAEPEIPCKDQAVIVKLSFSAPPGVPTTSPRVSSVSTSGITCNSIASGSTISPQLALSCTRMTNDVATLVVNTCEHGPFTLVLPAATSCEAQACRTTLQSGSTIPMSGLDCDVVEVEAGATIKVAPSDSGEVAIKIRRIVLKGSAATSPTVIFDGRGSKGATGGEGADCDHCVKDGRIWKTDKKEDFEGAIADCNAEVATWNIGKPGTRGGPGNSGARLRLAIGNARDVNVLCRIGGGEGGEGGPGGLGRKLVHNTGGLPFHECNVGPKGPDGPPGADGSCFLNGMSIGVR